MYYAARNQQGFYMNFVSENKKVDQIYLGSFKIWCWRRIEKNQLDRSWEKWRNLQRVKEEIHLLHLIKRMKAEWNGHILRRNCILKHVNEGKKEGSVEVTERRGSRRRNLLKDLYKKIGYWKLNTRHWLSLWRIRFGRSYGPVVRESTR